jgi:hypothetical protein
MQKFKQWRRLSLPLFAVFLVTFGHHALAAKTTQTQGDFHLSLYHNQQGQLDDLELFTKMPDKEVYFGLTCSAMSPFPMLEVLLFNREVLIDLPRLLKVSYQIDGKAVASAVALQGILKPVDTADEYSNKVRLELVTGQLKTMGSLSSEYQRLLSQLKAGQSIQITLMHRGFGEKQYLFSLQGLKALLQPNESICH